MLVATVYCVAVQQTLQPYARQERAKAALSEGREAGIVFCTRFEYADYPYPVAYQYHDRVRLIHISEGAAEGLPWQSLRDLPYLRRVVVHVDDRIKPHEFASLAEAVPHLESLEIWGDPKQEHFQALSGLVGLQTLEVYLGFDGPTYSHAGLYAISRLKTLRTLVLSGDGIEKHEFYELTKLPELTSLEIVCHGMDEDCLVHLKTFEKLTALSLNSGEITDAAATSLVHLSRLESLGLVGTQMRGDTLSKVVALCPDIRVLNLQYNQELDEKNFMALLELHKLEELVLSESSIGNEAAGILARHSTLKRLDVSYVDADLSGLVHSQSLEWINLDGSSVQESDVEKLLAIPTLKEIVWSKPLPSAVQAELDRRARR
jgi:hypothetical protein